MIISEISDFKKDQLRYELRNEPPNNFAIYIDGKKWKVFKGEGFNADDAREQKQFTRLQNLCKRKSFETGKDWQVGKTGEQPTQEGMFDKIKKAVDDVKNFHKTDAAKQIKKDHEKRVQKGKEIIDAPNLRKRIQDLQQNEAKQAKASDPKPKLIKPSKGGESPHPMRGKLVGEAVPYRKSVQKDLDDRIWNAKPPVKKDKNKASDDVERERRWKDTVRTKAEEGIRPEKPSKNSEELLAMGYKPDSDKVQRAREYEAWVEKQRAQGKNVDEGKSPHKKGSAKYKKHMAAMHAGLNEGPLVLNRDSDLRAMLDTLLQSWLSKGDKSDNEYAELLKALGYRMERDGQRTTLVKETEEPKADTSARAKLNHSLVSQGHKVEKDKKKELKKGAVKHKGKLYDHLVALEDVNDSGMIGKPDQYYDEEERKQAYNDLQDALDNANSREHDYVVDGICPECGGSSYMDGDYEGEEDSCYGWGNYGCDEGEMEGATWKEIMDHDKKQKEREELRNKPQPKDEDLLKAMKVLHQQYVKTGRYNAFELPSILRQMYPEISKIKAREVGAKFLQSFEK